MAAASTTENFDCKVEDFYKIITDYENYPKFIPEVISTQVLKEDGNRKLVEFEVNMMKQFKYRLWITEEANKGTQWELESGEVFKKQSGSWKLADEGGKTKADYSLEASFGMLVPKFLVQKAVESNLPAMMSAYRKRVKELHG